MKTYYLREKESGLIHAKFESNESVWFEGCAYECSLWENINGNYLPVNWIFHSNICAKFDGCSHWFFYGEDYNGSEETEDSYYHLCGTFTSFIIVMCFIWKIAGDYYIKNSSYPKEEIEKEYNLKMVNDLLEGYEIIEE